MVQDTLVMETAIKELEAKREQDPFNKKIVQVLGDMYFEQKRYPSFAAVWEPIISRERNCAPEIILKFENILLKNPQNKELLKILIKLHIAEGSIPEALAEMSTYLDQSRHDEQALKLLLKLSHEYKKVKYLIPVLEKAVHYNMQNSSLLEVLAGIYLNENQHAKAIKLYEQCIAQQENNPAVWQKLADLYLQHKHFEKSSQAFQKLLALSADVQHFVTKLENICAQVEEPVPFLYLLAVAYLKLKNPDQALEKYQQILNKKNTEAEKVQLAIKDFLKTFPDYPEANFLISKALIMQGNYSEAVGVLNKIIKLSTNYAERVILELKNIVELVPQQAMALQSLAEIYMFKGDYALSLEYYSRMLDLVPEAAETVVEKAKRILKSDPQVIKAREIIAKSLLTRKNYRRAINEAEAIIALDQNNAGAYIILGRSQLALQDYERSGNSFKTALNIEPYRKEIHTYYQQASCQKLDKKIMELTKLAEKDLWRYALRYELALAYFHRGLLNEAISEFQVAVRDESLAADVHRMQGICFKELGRYDLAVQQFQKALEKLDPNDIPDRLKLQFYIGLAYEAEGRHQEALLIYEEIMTQDINYENIQIRMQKLKSFSWVEIRGKALAAIIADFEQKRVICSWAKNNESEEFNKKHKHRNIDMSFSMEHNNKAVEHVLKGRWKAAEEELQLAQQMDPAFTITYNNHAVLALMAGNYEAAETYLKKALELNSKIPIVYANLGVLYHLKGQKQKAQENYEKSLALDNSMFTTQINLGDVYYDLEDVPKAMVYWNKVLDLGVVPELAKRRLKYRQP